MPTLDIEERQVLVDFLGDADGFIWHHRILLLHLRDAVWIICTPDLSVQQCNLADHRLVMLGRNSPFPADRVAQTYACDLADFTPAVLTRLRGEAQAMSAILGGAAAAAGAPAAAGAEVWRISDTSHKEFGEEVPPAVLQDEKNLVRRGGTAMVCIDNSWTTASKESESSSGPDPFRRRYQTGHGRDPRLLGHFADADGRRHIGMAEAIALLQVIIIAYWPIDGPRTVKEFLLALRSSGYFGLVEYHHDWVRNSGVSEKSAVCREHRFLLEVLKALLEFDQLDVSSLAGTELLLRRIFQIEIVVERNARQPDFDGLEALVETSTKASGSANVPSMSKWFSEHQKSEAFVLKQMRLWSDEQEAAKKRTGDQR